MSINVRQATDNDVPFICSCNVSMAAETEDVGLEPERLEAGIRYLMDHPAEGFYLVAEDAASSTPVGTLMVTFEWSDWRNGRFWWIQSVYVTAQARRQGVYAHLHEAVRHRARQDSQACGIRLYVEQDNQVAMTVYRQMGMFETHYRLYEEALSEERSP